MAIAIGVSSKGRTGAATTAVTTGVVTQASGSIIFGGMIFQQTFSSYTDNKSNTPYVQIGSEIAVGVGKSRAYYFANAAGGSGHTTTATVNLSTAITNLMCEITGAATVSPLDVSNGSLDSATPFTQTITPTAGIRLIVVFLAGDSGSNPATHAEANGFTILTSAEETNGASFWEGCLAYKIVACDGTTAVTVSFTDSGAGNCAVFLAAFKEANNSIGSVRGVGPGYGPLAKRILARGTRSFASAGLDVTVALTGSAVTYSTGTLVPSSAVPLVGSQYAWSAGTLTPSNSIAMTGTAVALATGTLVPSTTVPLAGTLVTFSTDTITAATNGDLTLALTGQAMSYATGTLTPSTSVPLTGSAETYSTGTLAVNHAQPLSGIAEAYSTGVLTPATSVSLAGSLVAFSTDTLSAQAGGDITVALTGTSFSFSSGTLIASGADSASQPSGGFFYDIDHFRSRKRAERDRLARHESDTAQLEATEREIAELLRDQERKDIERDELRRVQRLADDYSGRNLGLPRRLSASLLKAYEERTRNSLEQLQRELERMMEEEEVALLLILNDD